MASKKAKQWKHPTASAVQPVPQIMTDKAMRDCPECGGHGGFESCPQHGGANCPCDAYASACERCEGDGVIPVVCPECFEAEMPVAALICDACYAEILFTEGAAIERQMALPFVLDAKVDALLAAAERLDEGSAMLGFFGEEEVSS